MGLHQLVGSEYSLLRFQLKEKIANRLVQPILNMRLVLPSNIMFTSDGA